MAENLKETQLRLFEEDGIHAYTNTVYKMAFEKGQKEARERLKHEYSRPWHWAPLSFMIGIVVGMVSLAFLSTVLISLASSFAYFT